jgi:hypothetical protein
MAAGGVLTRIRARKVDDAARKVAESCFGATGLGTNIDWSLVWNKPPDLFDF